MKLAAIQKYSVICLAVLSMLLAVGRAHADEPLARERLIASIASYASQSLGVSPQQLQVLATDKRLKVPDCPTGFQHSFPFGDQVTIKTTCLDPEWQAFIRIKVEREIAQPQPLMTESKVPGVMLVLRERIHRGQRLSDVVVERRDAEDKLVPDALTSSQGLELLEATRLLRVGEVLRASMVKSAPAVKKGELVTLSLNQAGLSIAVDVEALANGQIGEVIRVKNRESGQELQATVTGIGQASL